MLAFQVDPIVPLLEPLMDKPSLNSQVSFKSIKPAEATLCILSFLSVLLALLFFCSDSLLLGFFSPFLGLSPLIGEDEVFIIFNSF